MAVGPVSVLICALEYGVLDQKAIVKVVEGSGAPDEMRCHFIQLRLLAYRAS